MPKSNYMPASVTETPVWLSNFSNKLPGYATLLAITPAEITSVANDTAMCSFTVNTVETLNTSKLHRTGYRNLMLHGPLGSPAGAVPVAPVLPAAPTAVAPGILPRIAQLVQRIKNHPNYTETIGKDLGIVGAEKVVDPNAMKPMLKLVIKGGEVEVQWKKGDADAISIDVDRGSGWQFLAVDTVPHYTDSAPITAPATWKYRAIYLLNDAKVGQMSDVASIAVS